MGTLKQLIAAGLILPRLGGSMFQPEQLTLRGITERARYHSRGDNPLDRVIAGTHYKAYLEANPALAKERDITYKATLPWYQQFNRIITIKAPGAHEKQRGDIIREQPDQGISAKHKSGDSALPSMPWPTV